MANTNEYIIDNDKLKELLSKLGLEYEQGVVSEALSKLAHLYDYQPHDISTYGTINGETLIGVVVTSKHKDVDNGIYVFHTSQEGRVMLSVLQPSTIDRQNIVNHAVLNIEMMLSDTDLPTLTPDDIVRTVYELLKRQICDASAKAQQLPDDTQAPYSKIYMDLLLQNLYLYHTQDSKYQESVVNDQPNRIRTLLLHSEMAEKLSQQVTDDITKIGKDQNKPTANGDTPC